MKRALPSSAVRRSASATAGAITIEFNNQQRRGPIDEHRLCDGVRKVLDGEGCKHAVISVAVVDDATIHEINRRYLEHDEPTDVISFVLDQRRGHLEGEIVVSADTAAAAAGRFGWTMADELLLYLIHGALHLLGYDDRTSALRQIMRKRERFYLAQFGLQPRYQEPAP